MKTDDQSKTNNGMLESRDWKEMWDKKDIGFHQPAVLPDLVRHEDKFLPKTCRVYLPLCGKSLDLVYLADKGHDVHGCEFVTKAIQEFFREQDLEYTTSTLPSSGTTVFRAKSKNITLYQGDFFDLKSNKIGKFDAVWDRASFVAINPSERIKYAKVMQDLMTPISKYLLNTFVITGEDYQGPPHSISEEAVETAFGSFCDIKLLDKRQVPSFLPQVKTFQILNRLLSLKK